MIKEIYLSIFISVKSLNKKPMYLVLLLMVPFLSVLTNVLFPFTLSSLLSFLFLTIIIPLFIITNNYECHKETILYTERKSIYSFSIISSLINFIVLIIVMTFIFFYFFFTIYLLQVIFGYVLINNSWFFTNREENLEVVEWSSYEFITSYFAFISMVILTFSMISILDMFGLSVKIIYIIIFSYLIISIPIMIISSGLYWSIDNQEIFYEPQNQMDKVSNIISFIVPHTWTTSWFKTVGEKSYALIKPYGTYHHFIHSIDNLLKFNKDWNWNIRLLLPYIFLILSIFIKTIYKVNDIR